MVVEAETPAGPTTLSGTSMAQLFVAGAALQTLEGRPELVNDSAGLNEALTETALPMPNAAATEAGRGMVAADMAITGESQQEKMDDTHVPALSSGTPAARLAFEQSVHPISRR